MSQVGTDTGNGVREGLDLGEILEDADPLEKAVEALGELERPEPGDMASYILAYAQANALAAIAVELRMIRIATVAGNAV